MAFANNLYRFIDAQETSYQAALAEIKNARKQSHWMWYIFPQIQGLGFSEISKYYAIKDLKEASDYLQHPVLGNRLIEISEVLLKLESNNATKIFGSPDDLKLKSSMTLFTSIPGGNPVFQLVLEKFFYGTPDIKTLQIIKEIL
jgi:uncharacterized protein (DUF1810 family)